jgi:hypothetical protein
MALIDNDQLEFMKLQKLSMSNWRIVDVDHYSKGNSFFNKFVTETDWHKDVEARIGTHEQRVKVLKEPDHVKEIEGKFKVYNDFLNMQEPRSNRGIEVFKSNEELEAEKKIAKEKAAAQAK